MARRRLWRTGLTGKRLRHVRLQDRPSRFRAFGPCRAPLRPQPPLGSRALGRVRPERWPPWGSDARTDTARQLQRSRQVECDPRRVVRHTGFGPPSAERSCCSYPRHLVTSSPVTATSLPHQPAPTMRGFEATPIRCATPRCSLDHSGSLRRSAASLPLLLVAGKHAHSFLFSEQAFADAAELNELHVVSGARHVDLYDRVDQIPGTS